MSLLHPFQTPRLFPCDLKWTGYRASMGSCLDSVHLPGPRIQGFRPLVPSLAPDQPLAGPRLPALRCALRFVLGLRRAALLGLLLGLLPFLALADTAAFRFAWLSDTHVGSSTGEQDLRAAVSDINSLTGLSFVVLSGDVTEYGSREQLRLAKELLDGLKIPCHVIPGNHDTKWSESGATDFGRIWEEDRFVFEHGGYRFIGMHQGPLMKMGDGHWAPQDVRWLEETLKKLPDPNQPIIFVTHYPMDDGIANWYVVLDLLKKYNTQVVLCGHGHANHDLVFEGVPGVMGRSNLRVRAPVGGFNLVEVKDGKLTVSERRYWPGDQAPVDTRSSCRSMITPATPTITRARISRSTRAIPTSRRCGPTTPATPSPAPRRFGRTWRLWAMPRARSMAWRSSPARCNGSSRRQNAVYSTPDVSGDVVVFASTDGNVYALKAATGKEVWRYPTSRPIVASPRIAEGMVYIGSSEGVFRALDLATGKLVWQFDGLGGFVETKPLVYDGKVIFGAWDQYLYALDARTGKLAWSWKRRQARHACSRPPPAGPSPPMAKSSSSPPTAR